MIPLVSSTMLPKELSHSVLPARTTARDQVSQIMEGYFAALGEELSRMNPDTRQQLTSKDISAVMQEKMILIQDKFFPPVRMPDRVGTALLQREIAPYCYYKDVISLASTCKRYYSVIQKPSFWQDLIQREIPFPLFPVKIGGQGISLTSQDCYRIYKRMLSHLNKIVDVTHFKFMINNVIFNTKNTNGDIVILTANKEIYLITNSGLQQLSDFPIEPKYARNLTHLEGIVALKNSIVYVVVDRAVEQGEEAPTHHFKVVQWDYVKGRLVTRFSNTMTLPGQLWDYSKGTIVGKGDSEIIVTFKRLDNVGDDDNEMDEIAHTTINLNSKTMNTIIHEEDSNAIQISNGDYSNHKDFTIWLRNKDDILIRRLQLDKIGNDVSTAISPDEKLLAVVQMTSIGGFILIIWDLTNGKQQTYTIKNSGIHAPDVFKQKFKFISQRSILMDFFYEFVIVNVNNNDHDIFRMKKRAGEEGGLLDVVPDSSGLLVLTGTRYNNVARYYPLVRAAMKSLSAELTTKRK